MDEQTEATNETWTKCPSCGGELGFLTGEVVGAIHKEPACAWFHRVDPLEAIRTVNRRLTASTN